MPKAEICTLINFKSYRSKTNVEKIKKIFNPILGEMLGQQILGGGEGQFCPLALDLLVE